ncbi:collagen alpha-1(I) chain-like [Mustela putorius furo]|uniref:Collagen alpha-1(I) chain-like n=1 Tax=Mustela putorius furo TaxID=9669 RepID=A0A8U0V1T0_MUSPF|nr:collagen alpha-1(I) chain-like [Mustela putorius furo]
MGRDPEPEASRGAGLGSSAGGVAGPPGVPRCPGRGKVGRPRYLEDEGGPRPGSHLRRAPPARPPGPNPTERVQSPGERAAERGAGAPGGARGTRSPGAGRSPAPPLAKSRHLQKSLRRGPPPPRWGGGPGRKARGAARPSPPERRAPGPPLPSAPARRAPRNSRPANFKGPPAHQSARAAGPPRPRHSPLIRGRSPRRDLAGAPGRAPAPAPGSARGGSPGPPRAGPGVGEHRESRGRGGAALGRPAPPALKGQRPAPARPDPARPASAARSPPALTLAGCSSAPARPPPPRGALALAAGVPTPSFKFCGLFAPASSPGLPSPSLALESNSLL